MEKIIVRGWEDIKIGKFINNKQERCFGCYKISIDGDIEKDEEVSFETRDLDKAVKMLNALGGNFEYKPVEVIDTFTKFREFLSENRITYNAGYKNRATYFMEIKLSGDEQHTIESIEAEYNVDLQILN